MTKDTNQCLSRDRIQWCDVLPQYIGEYWLSLIRVSEQNAISKVTYIIRVQRVQEAIGESSDVFQVNNQLSGSWTIMTSCFLAHKQLSSHCVLTESNIKTCFLEALIPFDRATLSWLNRPTKASSANIIISGIKRFNMQSGRTQRFSMHKVTSMLFLPKNA